MSDIIVSARNKRKRKGEPAPRHSLALLIIFIQLHHPSFPPSLLSFFFSLCLSVGRSLYLLLSFHFSISLKLV